MYQIIDILFSGINYRQPLAIDKRVLVWMKLYPSVEDVPNLVR